MKQCNDASELCTSVEIFFEHDDKKYTLMRILTLAQQNENVKKDSLTLERKGLDGQTYPIEDKPQSHIESMAET